MMDGQPKLKRHRTGSRKTRWSVRAADRLAHGLITGGGIGTIAAVSSLFVFLAWVIVPLFLPASVGEPSTWPAPWGAKVPLRVKLDEHRTIGWAVTDEGKLTVFRAEGGGVLNEQQLIDGEKPTAAVVMPDGEGVAFGFADGSVRLGTIRFATKFYEPDQVDASIRKLEVGEPVPFGEGSERGMIERTPQDQFRLQVAVAQFDKPVEVTSAPIRKLDYVATASNRVFCALDETGRLLVSSLSETPNFLTGETEIQLDEPVELPLDIKAHGLPDYLLLSGSTNGSVYLGWSDGCVLRYSVEKRRLIEEAQLVEPGRRVEVLKFLLGRNTLLCGDDQGNIGAWFTARIEGTKTPDKQVLVEAHRFAGEGAAVTSLGISNRSRLVAAGYADGQLRVFNVTSEKRVARLHVAPGQPLSGVGISPKEDGLLAGGDGQIWQVPFDSRHPETTLGALFGKVWYEGYARPEYVWQSTGASAEFEPKLSLIPLVFGTIKATFYSLLIAVPLALLAAIYTSEFLHPRTRTRIKPVVEIMAGLPSVVLGFLAALVFAPLVERAVPAVLAACVTVPLTVLLGAYVWQLFPYPLTLRFARWRMVCVFLALPLGAVAAVKLGPTVERLLFSGDVMRWLDGQVGTGLGGWLLLLLPLSAVGAAVASGRFVRPWVREFSAHWTREQVAALELGRFAVGGALALGIALAASWLLTAIGLDPRGLYVGTYQQRNALIVGLVMGCAVIPIIYTIAEDALSSVPEHLRSASLGAGATPWQTAVRIVIPTAMSGLFSAVMVGMGRAVGETMIVLMAAGNVPVIDWNVFNGFRTLSANIAVELPEAVRNSTHYRTLFLAAMSLFLLTFMVNTVAELVRMRFRRRVYEL